MCTDAEVSTRITQIVEYVTEIAKNVFKSHNYSRYKNNIDKPENKEADFTGEVTELSLLHVASKYH